jgi:hypothetical protein
MFGKKKLPFKTEEEFASILKANTLRPTGEVVVTKAAVDPVWDLPGIGQRFGVAEDRLLLPAPPCEKFARLGWKITQPNYEMVSVFTCASFFAETRYEAPAHDHLNGRA